MATKQVQAHRDTLQVKLSVPAVSRSWIQTSSLHTPAACLVRRHAEFQPHEPPSQISPPFYLFVIWCLLICTLLQHPPFTLCPRRALFKDISQPGLFHCFSLVTDRSRLLCQILCSLAARDAALSFCAKQSITLIFSIRRLCALFLFLMLAVALKKIYRHYFWGQWICFELVRVQGKCIDFLRPLSS